MFSEFVFERDGVRVCGLDFGGAGLAVPSVAWVGGYAGEWTQTAGWLSERGRVVALDARGHGGSERLPADVSPGAHVADAVFVVEHLCLGAVVLIGQSFGGLTGLRLAAARPALVRGLVVADGGPGGGGDEVATQAAQAIGASLRRWPVPFATREAAVAFWDWAVASRGRLGQWFGTP